MTSRRTSLRSRRAEDRGSYEHLLEFRDVSLSFKVIKALDDVSFAVADEELFAVIGPNGAGKTSIFNCINGVYKPQTGSITWKGDEILGRRPDRVASLGVARTFQNIELFPHMTVLDNIMLGRHVRTKTSWWDGALWVGPAKKEELQSRTVAEDIIDFLEIARWRKYPVALLPYGVQKRVELGRALAMEPELLLLDLMMPGVDGVEVLKEFGRRHPGLPVVIDAVNTSPWSIWSLPGDASTMCRLGGEPTILPRQTSRIEASSGATNSPAKRLIRIRSTR